jgi:hypothetical protein
MDDATRELLKTEAIRALENYLATGLAGFRQKGLDRLHALGIDTSRCQDTDRDIEHLIRHVSAWC